MQRNTEMVEKEKCTMQDLIMVRKLKTLKMSEKHCRTWNIARNTQECGKLEMQKCRTCNMGRKLKIMENEKYTLQQVNTARNTEKGEKEKWSQYALEFGKKTENHVQ